jgi:hypothetical protein
MDAGSRGEISQSQTAIEAGEILLVLHDFI